MDLMGNVDVCFLTEAKQTDSSYTREASGFEIVATKAMSASRGGVALAYRKSKYWTVESIACHGPNVMSCVIASGGQRTPLIGVYIPPEDETTLEYLETALGRFQGGPTPIVLGDLNTELKAPRNNREQRVADILADAGVFNMLPHFMHRRKHANHVTWRQRDRDGTVLAQGRCDYILGSDRRRFTSVTLKEPPNYTSDHVMVVGQLLSKPYGHHRRYLRSRQRYPIAAPKVGPHSPIADRLFQSLKDAAPRSGSRTHPRAAWISDATWTLIDRKSALKRRLGYSRADLYRLNREIKASIKVDRKRRVAEAGAAVEAMLANNDPKGAWGKAGAWYRQAAERPPKPSRIELSTVTAEYADLYTRSTPPGEPIEVVVDPFPVLDTIPDEDEIANAVRRLRRGKAPGPTGLRTDQLKDWLQAAKREENPDSTHWNTLVELIQHAFETGNLPEELARSTMILLPKGGGQFRGIGLLESVWKVISSVMNRRLSAIELHDALHGFRAGRGTGTAIIEVKLLQQWARLKQVPLYGIFLDLRKAYDTLDRDRALDILEGYGVGPRALRLLRRFWGAQKVVAKQSGYHGDPFDATRGVTQGDIISPAIFNIIADAVIRYWLTIVSEVASDASDGVGHNITARAAVFYADDGFVGSPDKKWLQDAFEVLVDLFARVGLKTNTEKTKVMVCLPGAIRTYYSEHAYKRKLEGQGDTYRQRKRRRVQCVECGEDLAAGSVTSHMRSQHDMEPVPQGGPAPPLAPACYLCTWPAPQGAPIPCPRRPCAYVAGSPNLLRRHFAVRHPGDTFHWRGMAQELQCELCEMQVTPNSLRRGHRGSEVCVMIARELEQARSIRACQEARTAVFSAAGMALENVAEFRYLGRQKTELDSDLPALRRNLRRARQKWAQISTLLVREGATPRVSGYFYKAVVQSVLLYGSETWVWTQSMLLTLRGFHHKVARRLTGRSAYRYNGGWVYPPIGEALEAAGLLTIEEHITRRRNRLLAHVTTRPIYGICQATPRLPSTPHTTQVWWEQFTVDNNPFT